MSNTLEKKYIITLLNGFCFLFEVCGRNISELMFIHWISASHKFNFFSSLKEFLPKEYIKQRGAEKKVFQVCFFLPFMFIFNFLQRSIKIWHEKQNLLCRNTKTVEKWRRSKLKWNMSNWRGLCGRMASPSSSSKWVESRPFYLCAFTKTFFFFNFI